MRWHLCIIAAALNAVAAMMPAAQVTATRAGGASAPAAVPAYRKANKVAILEVEGEIDLVTLWSLERRMKRAVDDGADAIVLEIDTFGGRVDAALDVCNLLKDRTETPANVVAWVHPKAYSAGTIVALACREIVISPNGTMGAAAPVQWDPLRGIQSLEATERAKMEAPIIAEVVDSARRNHYDEHLVKSFVRIGSELWLVESKETGERVFIDREGYEEVFGSAPADAPSTTIDTTGAPITPTRTRSVLDAQGTDERNARDTIEAGDAESDATDPSKADGDSDSPTRPYITDIDDPELSQTLPPSRAPLSEADRGKWTLVGKVLDDDEILALKADEAIYFGVAQTTVADDEELKTFFGAGEVVRYGTTWSEHMVAFLTNPFVRLVLIVIFVLSLFIELMAPGIGVFGGLALITFLALVGAPLLIGMAQWWGILLILSGIGLVLVELFVLPGMGIAGVAGVVCLVVGLVSTFISSDPGTSAWQDELWMGMLSTFVALAAAVVGMWFISRQIHSIPVLNRIILNAELGEAAEPVSTLLEAMAPAAATLSIGDAGVALTDLHPSGQVEIAGKVYDVRSVGPFIVRGSNVRVAQVRRFVIEVEEASA